ncbi:hypothetical protein Patl1_32109 [Pistacia atlantica]|uniref:Uncharacterized protein n=1 Tax=Pistacia atlantica TaxID=434234 RepID=A0ACC1ANA3_9ROSI|nr:hypothetical protein Patl1_32109 [Pistacia atlantica]
MSTTSASSLVLPSLSPKTLSLYNPTPTSLSFFSSSSLKLHAKPISISSSFVHSFQPSRFVRHVAISSEFDQEEEVIYDKVTGRSRGFGFVTMSTIEEVEAAAQQFNGYELEGRSLRVNFGPPPPRREESFSRGPRGGGGGGGGGGPSDGGNRLYVGNLSWGVDDLALENLFSEQGKVVEARVVYDRESGRSRGFGFVTYSSAEEVGNAIESLDGVDVLVALVKSANLCSGPWEIGS